MKCLRLFLALTVLVVFSGPCKAQILWTTDGVPVCATTAGQETPSLISDGAGGAIVAWANQVTGSNYNIYAQRVDSNGNQMWGPEGVPVCTAIYDQLVPVIAPDGAGGAIIAWQDGRTDTGDTEIYAQRISGNGIVQWAPDGVPVSTAPVDQLAPAIASDGAGGAFIAFKDTRNDALYGSTDVYMQRIGPDGATLWPADLPIATSPLEDDRDVAMIPDGNGGAIIVWVDGRGITAVPPTSNDVYAQRVRPGGTLVWGASALAICTAGNYQRFPDVVPDGAGGAIFCWDDRRSGTDYDIFAQRVSSEGVVQWAPNGVLVCGGTGGQMVPSMQSDDSGGAVIAWTDSRTGSSLSNYDIYAQRMSGSGQPLWPSSGVLVCGAPGWQGRIKSAARGSGRTFLAWADNRVDPTNATYNYDVYCQLVDSSGSSVWVADGASACSANGRQELHRMIATANGTSVVVWQDARSDANKDIYAQKIGDDAPVSVPTIAAARALADGVRVSLHDKIVSAVYDGAFYVQESDRSSGIRVSAIGAAEGQRVDVTGTLATVDGERVLESPAVTVLLGVDALQK